MSSMPRKFLLFVAVLINLVFLIPGFAGQTIFGPQTYTRQDGPPQIVTESFSAAPGNQYRLVVSNNSLQDTAEEMVGDSFVYLNGVNIVGAHNFNQGMEILEVPVELHENNIIEVEVRGSLGGAFTVQVLSN